MTCRGTTGTREGAEPAAAEPIEHGIETACRALARHIRRPDDPHRCDSCGQHWPCAPACLAADNLAVLL